MCTIACLLWMTSQATGLPCDSIANGLQSAQVVFQSRKPQRPKSGSPKTHNSCILLMKTASFSSLFSSQMGVKRALMENTRCIPSRTESSQPCFSCLSCLLAWIDWPSMANLSPWWRPLLKCFMRFQCVSSSKLAKSMWLCQVPVRQAPWASSTCQSTPTVSRQNSTSTALTIPHADVSR